MHSDEIEAALKATLHDRRLSRSERKALRALIDEAGVDGAGLDDHARTLVRGQAFRFAREALNTPRASEVLDWLEDVVGVVTPSEGGSSEEQSVPVEVAFSPGEACLSAIVNHVRQARSSVDVCVFTITDDRISEGLLSAARRGIRVRLISDDQKEEDRGSDIARFREAGIPVALDRSAAHMHHKFALFDGGVLLTGSFNWTRAASGENHENLLVTADRRLVDPYQAEFERLWRRYGEAD